MSKSQRAPLVVFCMVAILCGVVMVVTTARGAGPPSPPVPSAGQSVAEAPLVRSPLDALGLRVPDGPATSEGTDDATATEDELERAARSAEEGTTPGAGSTPTTAATRGNAAGDRAVVAPDATAGSRPERGAGRQPVSGPGGEDRVGGAGETRTGGAASGGTSPVWAQPGPKGPGRAPSWSPEPGYLPAGNGGTPTIAGPSPTDEPEVGWTPARPPDPTVPVVPVLPTIPAVPEVPEVSVLVCEPRLEEQADEPGPPVTEPPVTEPPVTEPPVTEPPVTEPGGTEPGA